MVTILKAIHSNLFHMVSQRIPCLFHIAVRTHGRLSELQFDRRLPRKRNENFAILFREIVRTVTFFAETYAAVYPVVIDGNIAYVLLFAKRDERVPCLVIRRKLAGAAILFPFGNRFEQYPRNRFLDMFETNFFGLFIKARILTVNREDCKFRSP